MNIYEAVREILENRGADYLHGKDREMLEKALNERAAIVVNITGGVFQGASSNIPQDIWTVDYDEEPNVTIGSNPAFIQGFSTSLDPNWVNGVIEELADAS